MELKQIRYFLELARLEHMAKTADTLGISQPTLSKSLAALEKDLGIKLFDRIGNRLVLNHSGREFYRYASESMHQLDAGLLSASQSRYETSGNLQIACLTFAPILMPVIQEYMKLNPGISINLIQYNHETHRSDSYTDYDFLLTASYESTSKQSGSQFWVAQSLYAEENVLVLGPEHPLYSELGPSGEYFDLRKLQDSPFIIMRFDGHFREVTYPICQNAGFFPRSTFQTDDFVAKMNAIRHGLGAAFLPQSCLIEAEFLCPGLKYFFIQDYSTRREILFQRRKKRLLSEAAEDFWNYVLDYYGLPEDDRE